MEHLSSDMEHQEQQVQWRRDKIQELCSKGSSLKAWNVGSSFPTIESGSRLVIIV